MLSFHSSCCSNLLSTWSKVGILLIYFSFSTTFTISLGLPSNYANFFLVSKKSCSTVSNLLSTILVNTSTLCYCPSYAIYYKLLLLLLFVCLIMPSKVIRPYCIWSVSLLSLSIAFFYSLFTLSKIIIALYSINSFISAKSLFCSFLTSTNLEFKMSPTWVITLV